MLRSLAKIELTSPENNNYSKDPFSSAKWPFVAFKYVFMSDTVKVSDVVARFFEEKGVKNVFLLSGGMMMHLLDSVSKSKSIKYVCMHHEQGCSIAAEGYARALNEVGICYATSGPAATNLVTGIAGSFLDSVPVMFITGQSRTALTVRGVKIPDLRMIGSFEVNIVDIVKPITKYANYVDNPQDILYELEKAYSIAAEGRPGPVLIEVPLDIQGAPVDPEKLRRYVKPAVKEEVNTAAFDTLAEKIRNAKRPLLLGGYGIRVANQADEFDELFHSLNIPLVTTQFANDLVPFDDEVYIGKPGLRGDRAGNFAVQTADVIVTLGTSLHLSTVGYEAVDFAPDAYKIVIDVDKAVLEKNSTFSQMQIHADVATAINEIKKRLSGFRFESNNWVKRLKLIKEKFPVINEGHVYNGDEINPYYFIDALSDVLQGDEIIVTDSGSLYYITGQTFRAKKGQRMIVSGALGSMGYALPAAIGASVASPEKRVICLTGDGSMQMNSQELQTVSNYKLNCAIIIVNNKGYASIRNTQSSFLNGHIAASSIETGVTFPDWKKLADAYSLPYVREDKHSNMANSLREVVNGKGPVFMEVVMPDNVIMKPSVTSTRLENGSFRSNKLHEMSPAIENEDLLDINLKDF